MCIITSVNWKTRCGNQFVSYMRRYSFLSRKKKWDRKCSLISITYQCIINKRLREVITFVRTTRLNIEQSKTVYSQRRTSPKIMSKNVVKWKHNIFLSTIFFLYHFFLTYQTLNVIPHPFRSSIQYDFIILYLKKKVAVSFRSKLYIK